MTSAILSPQPSFPPLPEASFRNLLRVDTDSRADIQAGMQLLLQGRSPLLVIERAVSGESCRLLTERLEQLTPRSDVVPMRELGPTHYGTPAAEYLEAADGARAELDRFLRGIDPDPVSLADQMIQDALGNGTPYRLAQIGSRQASRFRARLIPGDRYIPTKGVGGMGEPYLRWEPDGASLAKHEDRSQVLDATQDGFEIQKVEHVFGVNICLTIEPAQQGGELSVWNRFGAANPESLSLTAPGYPYPSKYIEGAESFTYRPNIGDLYIVLADLIHSVEPRRGFFPFSSYYSLTGDHMSDPNVQAAAKKKPPPKSPRGTLTWFMGQLPSGEVVKWT